VVSWAERRASPRQAPLGLPVSFAWQGT